VVARSEVEARQQPISQFGANVKVEQDPDVLDTWFSSGLVFSRWVGLRRQNKAFYYPTSTLVTGFDIIFLWLDDNDGTLYGTNALQDVYIHGLVWMRTVRESKTAIMASIRWC